MARKNVKIIKATRDLQSKAGVGDIPAEKIVRAERAIEKDTTDFQDIAPAFLSALHDAIQRARAAAGDTDILINDLVKPVMELKANGRMFKYELVGTLANIMLGFLEHVVELDSDVIDIVEAHHKTLNLIVQTRISGDGGQKGALLLSELESVCNRYYSKNPQNFKDFSPQKK